MSIILKGIGLPKDNKILKLEIYDDGSIYEDKGAEWQGYPQGTAIQIPKGARLIDANLFKETIKDFVPSWTIGVKIPTYGDMDIMGKIYCAPTILESEEE